MSTMAHTPAAPAAQWKLQVNLAGKWLPAGEPIATFHTAWAVLTRLQKSHVDHPVACRIVHEFP
jgi:hypothetical protein